MSSPLENIKHWLDAIKTKAGQENFLQNDIKRAIKLALDIRSERLSEADVQLVRLLRNCVPLGEVAVDAILQGGVVPALVQTLAFPAPAATPSAPGPRTTAITTPPTPPSSQSGAAAATTAPPAAPGAASDGAATVTAFTAACAQLLANLASTGPAGAADVWMHCFPGAFLSLMAHPAGAVHKPATLALYSCCRHSLACSRALSAANGTGTGATPHPHTTAAGAGCAVEGTSAVGGTSAGAGAVRAIWEALLGRLSGEEEGRQQSFAEAQVGGPDWTSLLVGCVALRQGLLWALLALLLTTSSAPPPPPPSTPPLDRLGSGAGSAAAASASSAGAAAAAATTAAAPAAAAKLGPRLVPVLLHVLAHEVYELQGGGAVDLTGWGTESTSPSGKGGAHDRGREEAGAEAEAATAEAGALAALPVAAAAPAGAMLVVTEVVEAAARCLAAAGEAGDCDDEGEASPAGCAAAAAAGAAKKVLELRLRLPVWGGGGSGGGDGGGGGSASVVRVLVTDDAGLVAAVLEAGLEVLKSLTQREDGGRPLAGGLDLTAWLLLTDASGACGGDSSGGGGPAGGHRAAGGGGGVMRHVLGMLAALQPAPALREKRRRRGCGGGGGSSASPGPAAVSPPPPPPPEQQQQPVVVELPPALQALAAGLPAESPYVGYRGDLACVLANGAFRRRAVVRELLAEGGLELLLGQTHLDEHSPLAREWALWGVRNMAEGSEEVQARIAGLHLQTAVETPELRQLGMKLELDKATGKLKVSKTEEAEAMMKRGEEKKV